MHGTGVESVLTISFFQPGAFASICQVRLLPHSGLVRPEERQPLVERAVGTFPQGCPSSLACPAKGRSVNFYEKFEEGPLPTAVSGSEEEYAGLEIVVERIRPNVVERGTTCITWLAGTEPV